MWERSRRNRCTALPSPPRLVPEYAGDALRSRDATVRAPVPSLPAWRLPTASLRCRIRRTPIGALSSPPGSGADERRGSEADLHSHKAEGSSGFAPWQHPIFNLHRGHWRHWCRHSNTASHRGHISSASSRSSMLSTVATSPDVAREPVPVDAATAPGHPKRCSEGGTMAGRLAA